MKRKTSRTAIRPGEEDPVQGEAGERRADLRARLLLERERQRAVVEDGDQRVHLLGREAAGAAAGDDPRPAGDRALDDRRRDHLAVQHDREELADVLARVVAEERGAVRLQAEPDGPTRPSRPWTGRPGRSARHRRAAAPRSGAVGRRRPGSVPGALWVPYLAAGSGTKSSLPVWTRRARISSGFFAFGRSTMTRSVPCGLDDGLRDAGRVDPVLDDRLGRRERARIGLPVADGQEPVLDLEATDEVQAELRLHGPRAAVGVAEVGEASASARSRR